LEKFIGLRTNIWLEIQQEFDCNYRSLLNY
jgi:hypothetical protein